jgi:HAD superfamily hydrolase (TIGR01549 family)
MEIPKDTLGGIELLIFDLDGTIIDLKVDWDGLKQELQDFCLKNYNYQTTFTPLDEELISLKHRLGPESYHRLIQIVTRYELAGLRNGNIKKDIAAFIKGQTDKKMAIYSANTRKTIRKVLNKNKIDNLFGCIIAKEDVLKPKPASEGLSKILKFYGLPPEKALFIGNDTKDKIAGENAGIRTILV